jgi:hypothetical protein
MLAFIYFYVPPCLILRGTFSVPDGSDSSRLTSLVNSGMRLPFEPRHTRRTSEAATVASDRVPKRRRASDRHSGAPQNRCFPLEPHYPRWATRFVSGIRKESAGTSRSRCCEPTALRGLSQGLSWRSLATRALPDTPPESQEGIIRYTTAS